MGIVLIFIFFSLISSILPSYGFDSLDPNGKITITWDFMSDNDVTYDVRVSIHNFQLFRQIDLPGWKLKWAWKSDEVIWKMWGAEATEQGNCTRFSGEPPHCCLKEPTIVDLMPGAPYNIQTANCCRGGVLTSMTQDPTNSVAAFQMNFNKGTVYNPDGKMPENFTLGIPGYTCGKAIQVPATKYTKNGGRRWEQYLETWNVTCTYSQFRASPSPKCCVSLSAFYNSTIVPCPQCSCNCQGLPGAECVKYGETPPLLQLPHDTEQDLQPLVRCSQHMCPIRVHWHIKESYREYWRVKITITNLNFVKNYSQWNLVVVHPNLQSIEQIFSFNYKSLDQYGNINDTGMFWGVQYYNDMLLSNDHNGNAQSEVLLHKDKGIFNFKDGWAFPRRISFNGDECVMPPPDDYPRLPNSGHIATRRSFIVTFLSLIVLMMVV
ncbi:COBRA-like protein [Quillaja saponaria]|uniref:COBRA-like protein n=1 Tax=Quillaja saponaria TaxID=32244 RepID=A0AAD7M3J3_QUISA|nr:COBRA-like protein [Quillaja saponaria]